MRAARRIRVIEWGGRLALVGLSCVLGLACAEIGARWLEARRVQRQRQIRRSAPAERFDPVLGWAKIPGSSLRVDRGEFDITFHYNSHGLRGPDRDYERPPGVRRVLLLGDSFGEGYYVKEHDTARAVLERLLAREAGCGKWQVINGCTAGYSTDQEYLFYRDEGHRYGAELVVVLLYHNDLDHNTRPTIPGGMRKPLFDIVNGRLELTNVPLAAPPSPKPGPRSPGKEEHLQPWRGSIALRMLGKRTVDSAPRLFDLLEWAGLVPPAYGGMPEELTPFGVGPKVPKMWSMVSLILRTLNTQVRADGARLALLYVPVVFEVDRDEWALTSRRYGWGHKWRREKVAAHLRSLCAREGIEFVDPSPQLRAAVKAGHRPYFRTDFHWNEVGNRIAAEAMLPLVQRQCDLQGATGRLFRR
jgi:hypothetical protein